MQAPQMDLITKKIKDAECNISWYSGKIRRTSRCFIVIGILGCVMSLYYNFTARHHSMMMMRGPPETHNDPTFRPQPFFTREEFDIYDGIKMMTSLSFFFFCKFIALGRWGRWATWWKKSEYQSRMFKKSIYLFFIMVIVSVLMGY